MATRGRTADRSGGSTTEQLRDDIDSGRTRDKVPARDPAAAPLGTDDEAAGTTPAPEVVANARHAEAVARGAAKGPGAAANPQAVTVVRPRTVAVMIGGAAVVAALIIIALLA